MGYIERLKNECAYYEEVLQRTKGKNSAERTEAYCSWVSTRNRIARYSLSDAFEQRGVNELEAMSIGDSIYYKHLHKRKQMDERLQIILNYIYMAEDRDMLLCVEEVLDEVFKN